MSHPYLGRKINRRGEVPYCQPIPILGNVYIALSVAFNCTHQFVGIPYTGIKIAFNLLLSFCQCSSGCGWTSQPQGKDAVM